ncbi:MAG TPA: hypothetical protein VE263_01160 [Candidatus Angelobacter sp.]|nr:hypothetical protein [Candidatus Angelobacter sp.]
MEKPAVPGNRNVEEEANRHSAGDQWQYDPYHNSITTVGNGGAKPTQAAFTLFYNQGRQRYDLEQTLQPDEQMWIDVGKLIRQSVPDKNGKTLPRNLTSGSYEFRDLTNKGIGTLFEGKIIYDKTYGHVTYGCATCCGYNAAELWYDPINVFLPGPPVADGVWGWSVCDQQYEDVSTDFYGDWSSGNTSIVTVDYYGTHTPEVLGTTNTDSSGCLESTAHYPICPNKCYSPGGGANVGPRIDSITPDTVLVGSNITQVTIVGAGFGSSPTVNLPQGVTVVGGQGSTDTQIILNNVAVSTSAPIGPNSMTVTVHASDGTNQPSNQSAFTLDGPFYMVVQKDIITTCSVCITTVARETTYQVMNFSNVNSGSVNIGEPPGTQVDSGWNCQQTQPSLTNETQPCPYTISSTGTFTDLWSLGSDKYTPDGCGWNADDHWLWCPTGNSIGHLKGYLHNNAVNINGSVMPPQSNQMKPGTVINP